MRTEYLKDCRGLTVSTSNASALAAYERAADLTHGYYVDPLAEIDIALEHDPHFAMAHCLRAAIAVMSSEQGALPMLAESVAAVELLGARADERERAHAAAARAWLERDFERAGRLYGDIVLAHPHDLVALQTAHLIDFYLGESTLLRDRVAQVINEWSADVPGYGYLLGMYAFGLEETALYERAEDTGRRALELNPRDPWAVHAVAHVMEMQGRTAEGIEWLNRTAPDWADDCAFAYHNWWHLALYHLELGDTARALELYDGAIHPRSTQVPLELVDAVALLWRLRLRGVALGDRWRDVAQSWAQTPEGGFYAFNDVHALMAYAATGRHEDVARVLASLENHATEADTNARISRDVGLPLARGIAALVDGRASESVEHILPMRTRAHRFGGSHAQRDLVHLTLVEAAFAAGDFARARALVSERTESKPSSPFNWQLAVRAHEALADQQRAEACRMRAQQAVASQSVRRVA